MTASSQTPGRDADRPRLASAKPTTGGASNDASPLAGLSWLILALPGSQSALFLAFAGGWLELPAYLVLHLGLCAATAGFGGWWAAAASPPNARDRIAIVLQLVAWTTLAGPFGSFIAIGLLVPRAAASGRPAVTGGPSATLSRLELLHRALLDRRLRLDRAHAIRPLLDVIIDGVQSEKFDALSLISKRYVPAAAPALKRALEDRDGSVRVLAATVAARQHNAFTRRIGDTQEIARAAPDAPGGWRDLGQAHLDYARSGLLEVSRVETELGHARTYLARAERPGRADTLTRSDPTDRLAVLAGQPTLAGAGLAGGERLVSPHAP